MEIKLNNDSFILSETDEKGIIKYVNNEFCEFSGYKRKEVIGKSHNIIRHQDMPKKIFEEMWETLKSGNTWKGFVKNAERSGKFYWVFATIYPFSPAQNEKGYLSCRRKATDEEIAKYSEIYAQMNGAM